jgi:lipoic acid synthetase
MILGDTCTRACKFCNVKTGNPKGIIDPEEPRNLAETVENMGLKYVVVTCVTRDDLPDGGAGHFSACVKELKGLSKPPLIELLISDLAGNQDALKTIVDSRPDVLAHNIETVERLQNQVRDPRTSYARSLEVLSKTRKINPKIYTKSSIMLGLGETEEEVIQAMKDLRAHDVDFLTLGQYLQPSPLHHPIFAFITPEKFAEYEKLARELGFLHCAAGALVRSSYKAHEALPPKN